MKRKVIVSFLLVTIMMVMAVVPALAGEITVSGDVNTSDYETTEDDWYTCDGDTNFNVDNNAVVGGINGNDNDVNISGSGTLTVNHDPDSHPSDPGEPAMPFYGISGQNVNIDNANVELTSNAAGGINANSELNITNSNVKVEMDGNGTAISGAESVTIDNSTVESNAEDAHAIASWGGDINVKNGSEVSASSNGGAIFTEGNGTINISDDLVIKTPDGGKVDKAEGGFGAAIFDASGNIAKNVVIGKAAAPEVQPVVPEDIVVPSEPCASNTSEEKKEETYSNSNPNATASAAVVVPPVYVTADPTTIGETAYVASVTASIANAPYGGTVKLTTGDAAFINRSIIDALETRSDVTLEISVLYGGVPYLIHIPAGFKLRELLGSDGKIDMNKLISMFGVQL